jgi:protein phosphatase 2C-like protein
MGNLTKYESTSTFKNRLRQRTGFCLDDPDRRYPVQSDFPARVLAARSAGRGDKADLLLAARRSSASKDRLRGLGWFAPLVGLIGWPEPVNAYGHHPSPKELPTMWSGSDWVVSLSDMLAQVATIDLDPTMVSLAVGGALLMTQIIGIRQRRRILKTVSGLTHPEQLDLFPETVIPEEKTKSPAFDWEVDAATRKGQVRQENQDAVRVLCFDDGSRVLLVCDGAGGVEGGGEASHEAIETLASHLQSIWEETGALTPADLEFTIDAARQSSLAKNLTGITTALLVLLQEDQLHFATLGDGAITVIWPDGMVGPVQVPHHTFDQPSNIINAYIGGDCQVPARTGSMRLEDGAMVLAMSDGASDIFPYDDFSRQRASFSTLSGLADHLLEFLEAARDPESGAWCHSDNMTLAMARLCAGGGHDQTD